MWQAVGPWLLRGPRRNGLAQQVATQGHLNYIQPRMAAALVRPAITDTCSASYTITYVSVPAWLRQGLTVFIPHVSAALRNNKNSTVMIAMNAPPTHGFFVKTLSK